MQLKKREEALGTRLTRQFNVAAYSAMESFSLFQRLVDSGTLLIAHSKYTFLNTQNENVRYQATKQHVFKDVCEYEAFRGVNLSCNK